MSKMTSAELAERKAQLEVRAALERIRMTLALHSVRMHLAPPAAAPSGFRRAVVTMLVGIAANRFGPAKLRRFLRVASIATAAYRIVSSLRR